MTQTHTPEPTEHIITRDDGWKLSVLDFRPKETAKSIVIAAMP